MFSVFIDLDQTNPFLGLIQISQTSRTELKLWQANKGVVLITLSETHTRRGPGVLDPSHGLKDIQIMVFGRKVGRGGVGTMYPPKGSFDCDSPVAVDGFDELSSSFGLFVFM